MGPKQGASLWARLSKPEAEEKLSACSRRDLQLRDLHK